MADWIKVMKGLGRRREVLAVARALSISRKESAHTFVEIWQWADDETRNGKLPGITTTEIDAIAEIEGFAREMIAVGWLRQTESGLELPRWNRHNGDNAKKRSQAAERMARKRERDGIRAERNKPRNKSVTREEKRREDIDPPYGGSITHCEELYSLYPKKVGRGDAVKAIRKALAKVPFNVLREAVSAYAQARTGQDPQFTPHPATWFNQERWNDDRSTWTGSPGNRPGAAQDAARVRGESGSDYDRFSGT